MLPDWPDGTVATLSTGGGDPHAIPVSTIVRAGDRALLFVLARRRESLARLREDPRCALTILAARVACTAIGRATVLDAEISERVVAVRLDAEISERVVAVRLDVERVQDHSQPTFEILEGVRWRWTDEDAERADAEMREALRRLAAG
ncbi:pyridoxamine 5'-phosphate oxidase family protein [Candidatus Solirubrobacter pratensis]|uniref:pyridoxamine 5'-phosphate oxidase family protein n=1 Tax=Candidatus Solirubrobacter pratensis TaxID=1298857 RepID=UPI00042A25CC|nr:pyridoxamine 5'-phosphate oxidase family protein [Candidatus Solirubrobacter pratensis]